jgi:TolB-like protein
MRSCLLALLLVVVWPTLSAAAEPPISPAVDQVLVLPFTPLTPAEGTDWISRAIQQNLLADLGRAKLHPTTISLPIDDPTAAARAIGVRFAITGTYQFSDDSLRVSGQILDSTDGRIVGGLSATGSSGDLYSMEDALSAQAIQQLRRLNKPPTTQTVVPAEQPAPQLPPVAQPLDVPPAVGLSVGWYQGSKLQQYVDANATPSQDYQVQYRTSVIRQVYWGGVNYAFPQGYGWGYFGYGYGNYYGWPYSFYAWANYPYAYGGYGYYNSSIGYWTGSGGWGTYSPR